MLDVCYQWKDRFPRRPPHEVCACSTFSNEIQLRLRLMSN